MKNWRKIKRNTSYLYLPSSEKGLVQSHGCPNRLFVCKLNIGKPKQEKQNKTKKNQLSKCWKLTSAQSSLGWTAEQIQWASSVRTWIYVYYNTNPTSEKILVQYVCSDSQVKNLLKSHYIYMVPNFLYKSRYEGRGERRKTMCVTLGLYHGSHNISKVSSLHPHTNKLGLEDSEDP